MTLQVRKLSLSRLDAVHRIPDLAIRLERDAYPSHTKIFVYSPDEPLNVRYRGYVTLRQQSQQFSGGTEVLITARRLVMLLMPGPKSLGLNYRAGEAALVSVDRDDLCPPERKTDFRGIVKQVDLVGSADPFRIEIKASTSLVKIATAMTPEWAQRLGPDAAAERAEARRQDESRAAEEAQRAAAERQKLEAERFADAADQGGTDGSAPPTRSLLDHLKTWHYQVAASPDLCVKGFESAFTGSGGMVAKAKWSLERTEDGAVARYQGRKGLIGAASTMSRMAREEEAGAIGSEVRFRIEEAGDGLTICTMWLANRTTRLGFTNDARFFKPYMRAVETRLRMIDPSVKVVKE